ncbi:MAG: SMI1/KNR4 family protein [Hymenobacter sp.]|nr:MAG: SMI1/KNR4 family protein [Hymenobacter sp.]
MDIREWQGLLAKVSEKIVSEKIFQSEDFSTKTQRAANWVGKPGATEAEIRGLEQRLLCTLPPSYRSFLATSNGFGPISPFIYDLYSTAEVDWLMNVEPELVDRWEEDPTPADNPALADEEYLRYDDQRIEGILKPTHLRQCLMISNWGDAGFLALNPAQQHEGEWEAWHFANWMPGAQRYRSFAELMQSSYREYVALRQGDE